MGQTTIGLNPSQVFATTADPLPFRLGEVCGYVDPVLGYQEFVFGTANGAVTGKGYVCVEVTGFDFKMLTNTTGAAGAGNWGTRLGVPQAVLADNEYGWFQIYGKGSLRTAASCAIGTKISSTTGAGIVDDASGTGTISILGMTIGTATGGAEATNADAMFVYPTTGVTN